MILDQKEKHIKEIQTKYDQLQNEKETVEHINMKLEEELMGKSAAILYKGAQKKNQSTETTMEITPTNTQTVNEQVQRVINDQSNKTTRSVQGVQSIQIQRKESDIRKTRTKKQQLELKLLLIHR